MDDTRLLRVPYGMTVHGEEEIAAVINVLKTSTQMGKHVSEMEQKVACLFDKKFGVMLNSGSSANYLAIEILGLPENSEVITPILTFSTTVAPLIRNKLIPVFADVCPGTYNIDTNQILALITKKTKAMMIPNLLGNLPDWQQIKEIADNYNLILIEDSADTLGATFNGYASGRFTDISTTSFYGSHVINCAGNGGMLCLNDENLASRAKLLRSWGRSSSLFIESENIEHRFNNTIDTIQYDSKFIFEAIGYNFEPSELGAAFGLVQLNKLKKNIKLREHNFKQHYDFFSAYEDWFILPKQLINSITGWLAFPLTIKDNAPFTRTQMQIFLEKKNIQTRTVFTGNILRQPGFNAIKHKKNAQGYTYADQIMRGGILIAVHHGLTTEMIQHIHDSFKLFTHHISATHKKLSCEYEQ
ncbi:aminotransferase class I/II-fold pyridoxal phosphate-dependent enzyme [Rickettsiella endosymbiont of Rhagonycha lignosa]|uniref:aminotransferase class I/II-fold pyridoxal phosphate-dependent enzyme n=1 Tax=Rickettsiella endosymbiont of Rhagonycha lignosa TaxID=3077937 RepID=UPI00313C077A